MAGIRRSSTPQTLWSRCALSQMRWTGSVRRCWHLQEKKKTLVDTPGRNKIETKTGMDTNSTTHSLFTSMWEELGVYLLESFLIYDATWTLLERERETKRERVRRWETAEAWWHELKDYTKLIGDNWLNLYVIIFLVIKCSLKLYQFVWSNIVQYQQKYNRLQLLILTSYPGCHYWVCFLHAALI